jgi:myo-inositol-1(or 4)-monophosphatase
MTTSPLLYTGANLEALRRLEAEARLVRYGCDCYAFAMLAAGHVDCVVETGLKSYDVVALMPIIEGAGGIITTWEGGNAAAGGDIIASGDERLHALALARLKG